MNTGNIINARNVNEALPLALMLVEQHGVKQLSRGLETIEVPGTVMTVYARPWENMLFDPVRDANPFFHIFEAMWILAGSDRAQMPAFFLSRIMQYSDNGISFHGAYGSRMRHWYTENGHIDQIQAVVHLLRAKPDTRQAVISIWDPELDLGAKTKDMPCNDMVMFKLRDGALNMTVCNRSNDVILGAYGANAVQFSFLQMYVAAALNVPIGTYTQVSDSFHVYTDNPLWQNHAGGLYTPAGHVVNPYQEFPELGNPFTSPLEAARFMQDCEGLEEWFYQGSSALISRAALQSEVGRYDIYPMLKAYLSYKNNRLQDALGWAKDILRPDWRMACQQWLERRAAKRGVL